MKAEEEEVEEAERLGVKAEVEEEVKKEAETIMPQPRSKRLADHSWQSGGVDFNDYDNGDTTTNYDNEDTTNHWA